MTSVLKTKVIENMELYVSVNHLFNHQIVQVAIPRTYLQIHMSKTLNMNEEQLNDYLKNPQSNRVLSENSQKEIKDFNQNPWLPMGAGLLIVDHDRTQVLGVCADFGLSSVLAEWRSLGVQNYFRDYPDDWQVFQDTNWEAKRKVMSFKSGLPKCLSIYSERLDWESVFSFAKTTPSVSMLLNYQANELTKNHGDSLFDSGSGVDFKDIWLMGFDKEDWDFSRVLDASKGLEEWSALLPEIMPVLLTSEVQIQYWNKWAEELLTYDYSFLLNLPHEKSSWLETPQHAIANVMQENLLKYTIKKAPQPVNTFDAPPKPTNMYRF